MNEVVCLDLETGREFTKTFYDLRKQRAFIVRCRHSRKVLVLSYTWQDMEEYAYLAR